MWQNISPWTTKVSVLCLVPILFVVRACSYQTVEKGSFSFGWRVVTDVTINYGSSTVLVKLAHIGPSAEPMPTPGIGDESLVTSQV